MISYQDFQAQRERDLPGIVSRIIREHQASSLYLTALDADEYDAQRNITVRRAMRLATDADGKGDFAICSNFFNVLNNQRKSYLLGNGVSFNFRENRVNAAGNIEQVDVIKKALGKDFDTRLNEWGYYALIHGLAFAFWNNDRALIYPITQFAPIWDEESGVLRAGARFWQVDKQKPMRVELYEADGVTLLKSRGSTSGLDLEQESEQTPYRTTYSSTRAMGDQIIAMENYPELPVIPMWGSRLKQSTLVGMRGNIDAFDLLYAGLARTLDECSSIYWIIQNCGGMDVTRQKQFLRDIRENHIAQVDVSSFTGDPKGTLAPYTQDVPVSSRTAFLQLAKERIYADFGAVDVHDIASTSTNYHIAATYQPMDDKADDFEYCVIDAVQRLIALLGYRDTPKFERNRVTNLAEHVNAVATLAQYLPRRAILEKSGLATVDEAPRLIEELDAEDAARIDMGPIPDDGGNAAAGDGA